MGRRLEMPPTCARCGKADPQYRGYCKKCLSHATWLHAIQHAWDPAQVRIKGHLYDIRPEVSSEKSYPEPTGGKGFGGHLFSIRFFSDGRIVKTSNLWSIGPIPDEYQKALPDNAEFLK